MLYIGIDIASKKHDCCIIDQDGEVLASNFVIENNRTGFDFLLEKIKHFSCDPDFADIHIGAESTGHYGNNIMNFLLKQNLHVTVFNPLQVNLYRKGQSLRKTKTDKIDSRFLALLLISWEETLYKPIAEDVTELKSLVRHRYRLKGLRSRLKVSFSRLVTILFPELPSVVSSIHQASVYALLLEYPTVKDISNCHLTRLTNLLFEVSKHRYGRENAVEIKNLAKNSIGTNSFAVGLELQQTIRLIHNFKAELKVLDKEIQTTMLKMKSPILTIPGISFTLGSIIISEIGNIENFENPNKLLAFAGLEPSTYQSGNFTANKTPMVKRGSKYLRWAILQAARLVARYDETFKAYFDKKQAEGKHYFVASSHLGKKLIRVIFHILKNNSNFESKSI